MIPLLVILAIAIPAALVCGMYSLANRMLGLQRDIQDLSKKLSALQQDLHHADRPAATADAAPLVNAAMNAGGTAYAETSIPFVKEEQARQEADSPGPENAAVSAGTVVDVQDTAVDADSLTAPTAPTAEDTFTFTEALDAESTPGQDAATVCGPDDANDAVDAIQGSESDSDADAEPCARPDTGHEPGPVPPPRPRTAPSFQIPGPLRVVWDWVRANPLLYAGLALLLVGISFAISYMVQQGYFTVNLETRLGLVALGGVGMLLLGRRLSTGRPVYGFSLMGGGISVLYLVLVAAGKLSLLSGGLALVAMLVLLLGMVALALAANMEMLAVLAAVGGFAAPLLLSTGDANHVKLFGYYGLLSAGCVALLRFRAWNIPVLLSYAATAGMGLLWGNAYYQSSMLFSVECFLVFFQVLFSVAGILLARHADAQQESGAAPEESRSRGRGKGMEGRRQLLHGSLLFGLPIYTYSCQYALVSHLEYMAALSALLLAVWYVGLAASLRRSEGEGTRVARESCLMAGLGFSCLAVPMALNGFGTTVAWAIQGVGLVWLGLRTGRRTPRWLGYGMQIFSALIFTALCSGMDMDWGWMNAGLAGFDWQNRALGSLLLMGCGLALTLMLRRHEDHISSAETRLIPICQGWTLLWYGVGVAELFTHYLGSALDNRNMLLAVCSLSTLAWLGLGLRWKIRLWTLPALALPPLLLVWRSDILWDMGALLLGADADWRQAQAPYPWGSLSAFLVGAVSSVICIRWGWKQWSREAMLGLLTGLTLCALYITGADLAQRVLPFSGAPQLACSLMLALCALIPGLFPRIFAHVAELAPARPYADPASGRAFVLFRPQPHPAARHQEQAGKADSAHETADPTSGPAPDAAPDTVSGQSATRKPALRWWEYLLHPQDLYICVMAARFTVVLCAVVSFVALCALPGVGPRPYVPLLSITDMSQLLALGAFWLAMSPRGCALEAHDRSRLLQVTAGAAFVFGNLSLARAVCWYDGVPYAVGALLQSPVFLMLLSLYWGLLALGLLVVAAKVKHNRNMWLLGAALLGLTLCKLLLLDMADRGTLTRVVSFMFMGLLMLVMGYFCPLPPRKEDAPGAPGVPDTAETHEQEDNA